MAASDSRWIKVAWKQEKSKEYNSLKTAAEEMISEIGHALKFKDEGTELDGVLQYCKLETGGKVGRRSKMF